MLGILLKSDPLILTQHFIAVQTTDCQWVHFIWFILDIIPLSKFIDNNYQTRKQYDLQNLQPQHSGWATNCIIQTSSNSTPHLTNSCYLAQRHPVEDRDGQRPRIWLTIQWIQYQPVVFITTDKPRNARTSAIVILDHIPLFRWRWRTIKHCQF